MDGTLARKVGKTNSFYSAATILCYVVEVSVASTVLQPLTDARACVCDFLQHLHMLVQVAFTASEYCGSYAGLCNLA